MIKNGPFHVSVVLRQGKKTAIITLVLMKQLVIRLLPHRQSVLRDIAIAGLALFSAILLVIELTIELAGSQLEVIIALDIFIAALFLFDFLYEYATAHNRKEYMRKNWFYLFASIPVAGGPFQAMRTIQLLRIIRIVRLYMRIKALSEKTEAISKHSSRYIFISLFSVIVIFTGSTLFYQYEQAANSGINTYFDAVWWSVVTATSVGYGDIYPVTIQGRVIAMALMIFGLALLGTIVGLVSNYFLVETVSEADPPPSS